MSKDNADRVEGMNSDNVWRRSTAGLQDSLGPDELLAMLPHRYPFLFVDRLIEIKPGRRAVGIKNVTFNEPYFVGHFPGRPVMPGALVLEAMAQTAAAMYQMGRKGLVAYLVTIERARFRRVVQPGDRLLLPVEVKRIAGKLHRFEAEAIIEHTGEKAAEATFSAFMSVAP